MENDNTTVKRGRGRPSLSEEEKKRRKELRAIGEMPPGRPVNPKYGQEYVEPGDNTKYLRHALATMELPDVDTSNPSEVEERIKWYFHHCADNDMKPTVNGLCNALGIHRDTLHTWKTGEYRKDTMQGIVLKAYRVMEELWEDYMLNGKINPVSGIFLAKNLLVGYSDKQEFVLTPNSGVEPMDAATIEAKYAELPDSED